MVEKQRSWGRVFCYALLVAAAILFFCSKSSPAYPINDWSDANVYFSAGKGLLSGRVMYRDLYDHKGPLLYALHALAALLSPMDFTGVYLLETLFAAVFLTLTYRLLSLYGGEKAAPLFLPLAAAALYSSFSFQAGDSAEEWALPFALFSLYDWLRLVKSPKTESARQSFFRPLLHGFLLGCVFWMKFTLCGVQGAICLLLLIRASRKKRGLPCLTLLLGGFLLSTLPWLLYFGLNGAIEPWLKTYLYDNLFLYAQAEGPGVVQRGKELAKSVLEWVSGNPLWALPALSGTGAMLLRRICSREERWGWGLCFALAGVGVWLPGRVYPYYALIMGVFLPAFFLPLSRWLETRMPARLPARRAIAAAACALGVALCPLLSANVKESFGQKREATMQYQFAALIRQTPSPTLLNYGFMDAGFYTAAGIVPSVKYYHQTNVPLEEMLDEQIGYIDRRICDYVVTRGKEPPSLKEGYDLLATAETPEGFWYDRVYLYRRKGLLGADSPAAE